MTRFVSFKESCRGPWSVLDSDTIDENGECTIAVPALTEGQAMALASAMNRALDAVATAEKNIQFFTVQP